MKLTYLNAALDDIDRLHAFLAEKNPEAAAAAIRKIRDAARNLAEFAPERGTPIGRAGFRQLFVRFGRSSYVIRYRAHLTRDELVVVRTNDETDRVHAQLKLTLMRFSRAWLAGTSWRSQLSNRINVCSAGAM